jgi:hypothetical protein
MPFELESMTRMRLVSVNPRRELHGKEHVPAVDLKLRVELPNGGLSMFDGHLLSAMYYRSAAASANPQPGLEGVEPVSELPNRRFPDLGPLKWEREQAGYEMTIAHGINENSAIELEGCLVNSFVIDPKEGGTVEVTFRVQCDKIDESALGKLCVLIDSDIEAALIGPEAFDSPAKPPAPAASEGGKRGRKRLKVA